ncbi:hypothetical protein R3Q15_22480 [Gordonia amicalis]|uniref:Uncharacterized protein n=1 Tax=Gordonia amicalis TaxID=89053 RepID=A0AAE4R9K3_9ACTN|nr:hypothetical protein [Gordonia amicalis]MDV6314602.1 hypothetical protein [Gordonia amicalis]
MRNRTGLRQNILDTLTPDSPQRQSYEGAEEDFNLCREALNAVNYRVEATNIRDVVVTDGAASLSADSGNAVRYTGRSAFVHLPTVRI